MNGSCRPGEKNICVFTEILHVHPTAVNKSYTFSVISLSGCKTSLQTGYNEGFSYEFRTMEAEQLNSIDNRLNSLADRARALRRYL
jgi:hypothetical protein